VHTIYVKVEVCYKLSHNRKIRKIICMNTAVNNYEDYSKGSWHWPGIEGRDDCHCRHLVPVFTTLLGMLW